MPAISNTIIKQKSRAKQRAELGDEEYKRIEAEKRKERRLKVKKQQTLNLATPSTKKTYTMYNKPTTVYTIDYIYKLKTDQAVAKGKTIKLATVEEQHNNIDKLHKLMFSNDMENLDFLRNTNNVLTFINTHDKWAVSSKNKIIQSISSVLSVLSEYKTEYKIYSDLSTKNAKIYIKDKGDIVNTEHFVEWDELKDLYKNPTDLFDKALISIYTLQPPRRLKDIQLMTITHNTTDLNNELNYILLDGDNKPIKLVYNNYKTASVYGVQTFSISAILAKILQEYINSKELKDDEPLFPNNKGKYYNNFSEIISKTFKKYIDTPISVNILRHSFIIDYLLVKRSINERKKIADQMAHSISVQEMYDRMPN
jgi:hypothetical protein